MVRRMDRADFLFINRAFGIEQSFVQVQERVAELHQRAPDSLLLRAWLEFCFPSHDVNNNTTRWRGQRLREPRIE